MEKRTPLLLKDEQGLNKRPAELKASNPVRLHNYHASKDLNAFIAFDEELFSSDKINTSETGLPLSGLPFSCKDNINVKGFATTAGTPGLIDFYPMDDAPVISRLKALGAVMCGKTNMHELSFGVTSLSGQWGSVGNPAHPGHIAGGSSGSGRYQRIFSRYRYRRVSTYTCCTVWSCRFSTQHGTLPNQRHCSCFPHQRYPWIYCPDSQRPGAARRRNDG